MKTRPRRLLILGGTAEAAGLAREVAVRFGEAIEMTTSFAGRTNAPAAVPGAVRSGGFGGVRGLADYLRASATDLLIDATHPFAVNMSRQARLAAAAAGIEFVLLLRPSWRPEPGDRWIEVPDVNAAAQMLLRFGRRVFLTVGGRDLAPFAAVPDARFVIRLMAPRETFAGATLVIGRPPFTLDDEIGLLHRHAIELVVSKASGGARPAKLDAARSVSLPVILVARPMPEPGPAVESITEAVEWIAATLAGA